MEHFTIEIPEGLCQCGCGGRPEVSQYSRKKLGHVKGQPKKFIAGHSWRNPIQVIYGQKLCNICQEYKSVDNFYSGGKAKQTHSDYTVYKEYCKSCVRANHLRYITYGETKVTLAQFDAMIEAQDNCCLICNRTLDPSGPRDIKPNIDHCHKTGEVRGILCGRCNKALGLFNDDVDLLQAASEYLS
jgi:hypothetical protein